MTKKLPKTLYVRREVDRDYALARDYAYLVAEEQLREHLSVSETRLVGKYQLVEQVELSTEVKTVKK